MVSAATASANPASITGCTESAEFLIPVPVAGVGLALFAAAASIAATAPTANVLMQSFSPVQVGLLYLPELGGAVVMAVVFGFVITRRAMHYLPLAGMMLLAAGIVVFRFALPANVQPGQRVHSVRPRRWGFVVPALYPAVVHAIAAPSGAASTHRAGQHTVSIAKYFLTKSHELDGMTRSAVRRSGRLGG